MIPECGRAGGGCNGNRRVGCDYHCPSGGGVQDVGGRDPFNSSKGLKQQLFMGSGTELGEEAEATRQH